MPDGGHKPVKNYDHVVTKHLCDFSSKYDWLVSSETRGPSSG